MIALDVNIRRKCHDGTEVLGEVAFEVPAGEVVCVLAPSGAGKTTLLNIVSGIDGNYSGHVAKAARRIGVVFQEPRLMPWLDVRRNLALVNPGADKATIDDWIEFVGLAKHASRFPQQLSLGMQRRAAMARALVVEPELVLLDEAFVSLDRPSATRLRDGVLEYARHRRITVLMTTHQLHEAVASADRILFLSASPARIVLDIKVAAARANGSGITSVQDYCALLHARYPRILEGSASRASRRQGRTQ